MQTIKLHYILYPDIWQGLFHTGRLNSVLDDYLWSIYSDNIFQWEAITSNLLNNASYKFKTFYNVKL